MGTKFTKKIYTIDFQKQIITDYLDIKSIKNVAIKYKITTRQVINILNDNNIPHNKKRKIILHELYFDKNDNQDIGSDVMYWAGFIAADGNIINNTETRNYFLTIRLSQKDKKHLEKFKQCINTNAKIIDKIHNKLFRDNKYWKETYSSEIVLNSKYIVNSLYKYNITPNKSKTYTFPIKLGSHKFINSFIRGYFDGDGSVYIRNQRLRINFYGTYDCLYNISKIISNNNNISLHTPFKNRSIYNLEYNGKDANILSKWLYDNANMYLDRKYDLVKQSYL